MQQLPLTDLERAARFLYLQRLAFGGKVTGQNFGVDMTGPSRFNLNRLGPVLEDVHERLAGVTIENLDWRGFIDRYDRAGTLFYLDRPISATRQTMVKACSSAAILPTLPNGSRASRDGSFCH